MYIYDDNVVFNLNENRIAFLCDETADISTLPTTTQPGTQMAPNNVSCDPVDAGSMAYIISTGDVYMLNSLDSWIKQPKRGGGGGGGGASALVDLTDVSISNLQDNQVIAWDAAQQLFINKTMEQVIHIDYSNIDNPPEIGGVPLTPDTTLQDLGIATVDEPNETVSFGSGD